MDRLSCPYCNASFDPPAAISPRVTCPRCGEAFAIKSIPVGPVASANGTYAPADAIPPPAKSLAAPAIIGLLIGLVVLVGGLYAVLKPPPAPPTAPEPSKPAAVFPPLAVPGIERLPADAGIAFAVQPGPILLYAERSKVDPQKLLASVGVPEKAFAALAGLGLTLDRIESLCGSLTLPDDSAMPRFVLVLTLRAKLPDEAAFRQALKATKPVSPKVPGQLTVTLGGLPAEMVPLGERAYLLATDANDLAAATTERVGGGHLPSGVRDSILKLSPASAAWVATDSQTWATKPTVKAAALFLKDESLPKRLESVKAAAVGIALEPDPTIALAVRGSESLVSKFAERTKATVQKAGDWYETKVPWDPNAKPWALAD
jgi:hypothetical protein